MLYVYLSLVCGLISIVLFVRQKLEKVGIRSLVFKTGGSIFFLGLTVSAFFVKGFPTLGMFILMGQIFGMLGDIFLDQKTMHPENEKEYTHMGFSVFGIGHIIFMIGLISVYSFGLREILTALVGALAITVFVHYTEEPMKLTYGPMALDVKLYSFILGLSSMIPASWIIFNGLGEGQLNLYLAGQVSFLISDLILSQIYFGKDMNKPALVIGNYVFYFGAQYMIAWSILLI